MAQVPRPIVVLGNCQAADMVRMLHAIPALSERFRIEFVPAHTLTTLDVETIIRVFTSRPLVMQRIADLTRWRHDLLPKEEDRIWFPFLSLRSLWPFDTRLGKPDPVALRSHQYAVQLGLVTEEQSTRAAGLAAGLPDIPHHDWLLARLRDELPDPEAQLAAYRAGAGAVPSDLAAIHDLTLRMLEATDARFGLTVGAELREGLGERPLFCSLENPCLAHMHQLCGLVWRGLGMRGPCPMPDLSRVTRPPAVPVHPAVAATLGLAWATQERRYFYPSLGEVTWEEFTRAYIARFG